MESALILEDKDISLVIRTKHRVSTKRVLSASLYKRADERDLQKVFGYERDTESILEKNLKNFI